MSLLTMSLGDRFCVSRKGGRVGWAHLQGGKCLSMFVLSFGWHLSFVCVLITVCRGVGFVSACSPS